MRNTDELTALKLIAAGRTSAFAATATGLTKPQIERAVAKANGDLQARITELVGADVPPIPKGQPAPTRLAVVDTRKACSKCKDVKLAAAFYRDPRNTKLGLSSQCRDCMAAAPYQKVYDDSKAVRSRAWARAQAQLRKQYKAEFEAMYQAELVKARAELADIKAAAPPTPKADKHGHPTVPRPTPLLKPGTRNQGESVLDRIREDVGRCPQCINSHDRGHTCPACGAAPTDTRSA